MLDVAKHAALVVGVLDLLHLDNLGLLQHLYCVEALVVLGLDEVDAAETTGAERPQDVKVWESIFALGDPGRRALAGLGLVTRGVRLLGRLGMLSWLLSVLVDLHVGGYNVRRGRTVGRGPGSLLLLLEEDGIGARAGADGRDDGRT